MTRTAILPLAAEAAENPAHTRSKPKRDESTAGANPTADEPGDGALNPQQQLGLLSLPVELLLRHILPRLSYYDMDQLRAATRLSLALIQDVKCCHGGEVFFNARQRLRLPVMQGTPTLVGLHTLLESTQCAYRAVICISHPELMCRECEDKAFRNKIERRYPGLFQRYSFSELVVPRSIKPLLKRGICSTTFSLSSDRCALFTLSHNPDIERIFEVIEAFLEMLNSPNLLDNFRTIVMQALRKQQGSRGHASNHQEVWFRDMLHSRDFDAFIHRFWLEVIGGGNIDQLRYYFKAMLAISAIPCILNMMLPANNYDKALALAKRIHLIPDFIDVVEAGSDIRVDYYELIVIHAFFDPKDIYGDVVRAVQRDGNIDINLLSFYFMDYRSKILWRRLECFGLQPSTCLLSGQKPSRRNVILSSPPSFAQEKLGHKWFQIFPRNEDILG